MLVASVVLTAGCGADAHVWVTREELPRFAERPVASLGVAQRAEFVFTHALAGHPCNLPLDFCGVDTEKSLNLFSLPPFGRGGCRRPRSRHFVWGPRASTAGRCERRDATPSGPPFPLVRVHINLRWERTAGQRLARGATPRRCGVRAAGAAAAGAASAPGLEHRGESPAPPARAAHRNGSAAAAASATIRSQHGEQGPTRRLGHGEGGGRKRGGGACDVQTCSCRRACMSAPVMHAMPCAMHVHAPCVCGHVPCMQCHAP
eukprot:365270-Chlamydomonas_euryale.AAC.18